jgi:integrase
MRQLLPNRLAGFDAHAIGQPMDTHKITASGLTGKLYLTADSPRWQLEFRHPHTKKRLRISTGLRDLVMAKEKAKGVLVDAGRKGLAALQAHSQRATSKSVGEAIDHYLRVSKIASRQSNVNRLLRLLRGTLGGTNEQVRAKPLSVLTPALVAKYLADWKGSIYTLRGVLVSARAVFCHALDWEGFPLPESLEKFSKTTKGMRAPSPTFERIAPAILDGMDRASRQRAPAIRRAFLLTRYLGMTPKECSMCRRTWIEERNDKFVMVVIERDGVTLKTGSKRGRAMSIPEWMAAELLVADDFMVDGKTPSRRKYFMERIFNAFVREFLPDRRTAAYELRRQAGSDILNATGKISVAQHMLGHSSPTTTSTWYAVYDREVDVAAVWDKA